MVVAMAETDVDRFLAALDRSFMRMTPRFRIIPA
jgi:hypothetical protein